MGLGGGSIERRPGRHGRSRRASTARPSPSTTTSARCRTSSRCTSRCTASSSRPRWRSRWACRKQVSTRSSTSASSARKRARLNLDASPEEVRKKLLTIPTFTRERQVRRHGAVQPLRHRPASATPTPPTFEEDLGARDRAPEDGERAPELAWSSRRRPPTRSTAGRTRTPRSATSSCPPRCRPRAVTVTPAEVEAYYKANQPKYAHGEQRKVRYLLADYAKSARAGRRRPTRSCAAAYEAATATRYARPAAAHVLHILVKVGAGRRAAGRCRGARQGAVARRAAARRRRFRARWPAPTPTTRRRPATAATWAGSTWAQTVEPFEKRDLLAFR